MPRGASLAPATDVIIRNIREKMGVGAALPLMLLPQLDTGLSGLWEAPLVEPHCPSIDREPRSSHGGRQTRSGWAAEHR